MSEEESKCESSGCDRYAEVELILPIMEEPEDQTDELLCSMCALKKLADFIRENY